jgi:hypothetical protein
MPKDAQNARLKRTVQRADSPPGVVRFDPHLRSSTSRSAGIEPRGSDRDPLTDETQGVDEEQLEKRSIDTGKRERQRGKRAWLRRFRSWIFWSKGSSSGDKHDQ